MYHKRFDLSAAAAVCVALALMSTERPARAVEPETVSITFALTVPFDPYAPDFDESAILSDYVGEDTVAILIQTLNQTNPFELDFNDGSLPCGEVEVSGTHWSTLGKGTIVNKGGPIYTTIWTLGWPTPPPHSALVAGKITDVNACWVKYETGTETSYAQEDWDKDTNLVFIIVTGEFRVKE